MGPPLPPSHQLPHGVGSLGIGLQLGASGLVEGHMPLGGYPMPPPPSSNSSDRTGMGPSNSGSANMILPPLPSKGASDFVKKLFTLRSGSSRSSMLEDELYEPIVSWTPAGDSFVVKNMNDFTKHVLPRHFRHSNFASFVRQLNKYDFHKVKSANASASGASLDDLMMDPLGANNPNISASGDQIWEFKHPDFIRGREDLLENVKRKAPTGKKLKGPGDGDREGSPTMFDNNPHEIANRAAEGYSELKGQVATLTAVQEQMNRHIDGLTKQYQGIIGEMLTWQRNMVQQDQLMQNLIQYLMNMENERGKEAKQVEDGGVGLRQQILPTSAGGSSSMEGPFIGAQEARQLIGSYADVASASFSQMSEITRRIQEQQTQQAASSSGASGSSTEVGSGQNGQQKHLRAGGPGSLKRSVSPGTASTPPPASTDEHSSGGQDTNTNATLPEIKQRRHGFSTGSAGSPTTSSPGQPQQQPSPSLFLHPPHFNDDGAGEIFNPNSVFGSGPATSSLAAAAASGGLDASQLEAAGLRVFTVGTLQPREDGGGDPFTNLAGHNTNPITDMNGKGDGGAAGPAPTPGSGASGGSNGTPSSSAASTASPADGGLKRLVPTLEELPKDMPRLDRRASLFPPTAGGPGVGTTKSPTPEAESLLTIGNANGGGGGGGGESTPAGTTTPGGSFLRVRRSTYVPGWAVPPRVLLVDDDAVCRKLSSKFLQVFGCAIDVAVDGVNAVNKMNLEKYDLVLMDIVMPNLDGVSATSLIRQFDPRTPIISMTSNSQPNELLTYMANGMTDVLPKPFTKEGLLNMLEKHLIHLKTVTQMEQIPRQMGLGSLPEGALQSMISNAASLAPGLVAGGMMSGNGNGMMNFSFGGGGDSQQFMGVAGPSSQQLVTHQQQMQLNSSAVHDEDEDGSLNPLASLGFSDSQYIEMLQNFIASGSVTDSGQGEMTSSLAHAVGASASLGEGQGGARRPSQAVLAPMATQFSPLMGSSQGGSTSSVSAGKKRKSDAPAGSIPEVSAAEEEGSSAKMKENGGRKRQRIVGSS
ncbi:kinase-regulated stress-responsive transcription factor skn7 [Tilletia horrida]|nr:kinase-regulated stress-responsive transcription factor skn7 [Tilletia horrida]